MGEDSELLEEAELEDEDLGDEIEEVNYNVSDICLENDVSVKLVVSKSDEDNSIAPRVVDFKIGESESDDSEDDVDLSTLSAPLEEVKRVKRDLSESFEESEVSDRDIVDIRAFRGINIKNTVRVSLGGDEVLMMTDIQRMNKRTRNVRELDVSNSMPELKRPRVAESEDSESEYLSESEDYSCDSSQDSSQSLDNENDVLETSVSNEQSEINSVASSIPSDEKASEILDDNTSES